MAEAAKRRSQATTFRYGDQVAVAGDYFFSNLPATPGIIGTVLNVNQNGSLRIRWHCDQTRSDVPIYDIIELPQTSIVPVSEPQPEPQSSSRDINSCHAFS